jgi:hypothetical protein
MEIDVEIPRRGKTRIQERELLVEYQIERKQLCVFSKNWAFAKSPQSQRTWSEHALQVQERQQ